MGTGAGSFLPGVKVVDLSRHLPGPLATSLLADMGAEVIKVEPPEGDDMRSVTRASASGRSPSFDALNAGKRSVRLDLKTAEGRAALLALTDDADVVVESFRPGVLDRLGVGFETMRKRNPGLVCCSMSGFGSSGPLAQTPAHDINFLALSGILSYSGTATASVIPTPPLADASASLVGLSAILGALNRRAREGIGCVIDLGIADCVMVLQAMQLAELATHPAGPVRGGEFNTGATAHYNIYATRDGSVALGAMEPKFWRSFCLAAGRPDWISRQDDPLPQTRLIAELTAFFATMTQAEAVTRFDGHDCCLTPVLGLPQAIRAPHFVSRELVAEGPYGEVQALFPVRVDGVPPSPRTPFVDSPPIAKSPNDQKTD